jgi:hypothetical protein
MFKVIKADANYDYYIDLNIVSDNKKECLSGYTFNGYITDESVIAGEINKLAEFTFELVDEWTVRCHLSSTDLDFNSGQYKYLIDYTDNLDKKHKALSGVFQLRGLYD